MGKTSKYEKELRDKSEAITEEDEEKIKRDFSGSLKRVNSKAPLFIKFIRRLKLFFGMVFDENFYPTTKNKYLILGALLYFIIPVDLVADYIPVMGFIDDALVVRTAWYAVQDEIERYLAFKSDIDKKKSA